MRTHRVLIGLAAALVVGVLSPLSVQHDAASAPPTEQFAGFAPMSARDVTTSRADPPAEEEAPSPHPFARSASGGDAEGVDPSVDQSVFESADVPVDVYAAAGFPMTEPADNCADPDSCEDLPSHLRPKTRGGGGGGSGTRVRLPAAGNVGDYFCYHSSTYGVNHGHVGMYYQKNRVVEAPGKGLNVRMSLVSERPKVVSGQTVLIYVHTGPSTRAAAASWLSPRVGSAYRDFYVANRTYKAPFNCSQLVWGAYHQAGRNLDSHGGPYIWPGHLLAHPASRPYQGV